MIKLFIGVDPGNSGAIAFLTSEGEAWSVKNKETDHDLCEAVQDALRHSAKGASVFAIIEKVHSSPQMGVKSAFTFGESYGKLIMLLTSSGIPYETVTPAKWQGDMKCRTKGDKNITKAKAQQLFPLVKITHVNADALLLAEYASRLSK